MDDPFDLERFVDAQAGTYERALAELRAGSKRSHWIWFVFPQLAGLGRSATARRYSIGSLDEARGYLEHPVLGARLENCTLAVLGVRGRTAEAIFGYPDWMKFRSSMTLFDAVEPVGVFAEALERYFDGERDSLTLDLLRTRDSE